MTTERKVEHIETVLKAIADVDLAKLPGGLQTRLDVAVNVLKRAPVVGAARDDAVRDLNHLADEILKIAGGDALIRRKPARNFTSTFGR